MAIGPGFLVELPPGALLPGRDSGLVTNIGLPHEPASTAGGVNFRWGAAACDEDAGPSRTLSEVLLADATLWTARGFALTVSGFDSPGVGTSEVESRLSIGCAGLGANADPGVADGRGLGSFTGAGFLQSPSGYSGSTSNDVFFFPVKPAE